MTRNQQIMHLVNAGIPYLEIANKLGVSYSSVGVIVHKEKNRIEYERKEKMKLKDPKRFNIEDQIKGIEPNWNKGVIIYQSKMN